MLEFRRRASVRHNPPVLGITEAGLFPGVVFIFSVYYLR
jgi:hypothetical protein